MNPIQLSNEDLLKLLELPETLHNEELSLDGFIETLQLNNPEIKTIPEFIEKFKIVEGDNPASIRGLYNIYNTYYQNDLTYTKFNDSLKLLLSNAISKAGKIYIDANVSLIPPKVIYLAANKKKVSGNAIVVSRQLDEYLKFINHYNIKEGKVFVSLHYLYKIYCLFVKNPRRRYKKADFDEMLCRSFVGYWRRRAKFFKLNIPKEGLLCQEEQKNRLEN
jgi:hypothetical protein